MGKKPKPKKKIRYKAKPGAASGNAPPRPSGTAQTSAQVPAEAAAARAATGSSATAEARVADQPIAPEPAPGPIVALTPLAPIICRSGRPFDDQAGADPARFPPPSTVAGCIRTACAVQTGRDFDLGLLQIAVSGPLLACADGEGKLRPLVPKPADALYFGHGGRTRCVRAAPRRLGDGCGMDLPDGLLPVQLIDPDTQEKPGDGPHWWCLDDLLRFRDPDSKDPDIDQLGDNGLGALPRDRRTHVAIDPRTLAAAPAQLFQTEGLDFDDRELPLHLLVRAGEPLARGLAHLGGERRLARIEPQPADTWPAPPADWWQRIRAAGGLSLTLLTPALFSNGWLPGWLSGARHGVPPGLAPVQLKLRAAALDRWQPQSGWDLATQQPRAGRKLVPAGAVYWLRLDGEPSDDELAGLWLAAISDDPQDRRDGFGLALPAPWRPLNDPTPSTSND